MPRQAELSTRPPADAIEVAAGIIENGRGEILISQRPSGTHMAGRWELPGGKIDGGESAPAALRRELREELGILVQDVAPLLELAHEYPDRRVVLHVFRVIDWSGEPFGREGQTIRWMRRERLHQADLLEADQPIVAAIQSTSWAAMRQAD